MSDEPMWWKWTARARAGQGQAAAGQPDARQCYDAAIQRWLGSELGQSLSLAESAQLQALIPQVYSPVAVHLASQHVAPVLQNAQSALRIRANVSPALVPAAQPESHSIDSEPGEARDSSGENPSQDTHPDELTVIANPVALPFAANSIDLIVASHTLDMVADPHQVLRELHQVLPPEGHLIIVGFNPVSLWGIRRLLTAWRGQYPWTAGFIRLSRIKDWLRLLGFDITAGCICHYGMPVSNSGVRRRFEFLELVGKRWWPGLGGVYILVARKRDPGVTPVGTTARSRRRLAPQLAAPVSRRAFKVNDADC